MTEKRMKILHVLTDRDIGGRRALAIVLSEIS